MSATIPHNSSASDAAQGRPEPVQVRDLQDEQPEQLLALSHVGIQGVRVALRTVTGFGELAHSIARVDCGTPLPPDRRGAHMSRFHESIAFATQNAATPVALAAAIVAEVRRRQETDGAVARIEFELLLPDTSPVSQRPCMLPVEVVTAARVHNDQWRAIISVTVSGMNACPCAQELVRGDARARLMEAGYSAAESERILDIVPGATHNQRGTSTLTFGCAWTGGSGDLPELPSIAAQAEQARSSMGTNTHELLKRNDERAVVLAAHEHPRFVEDCTRNVLASCAADTLLGDSIIVWARQVNHESIHAHDVRSSAHARLGDLRGMQPTASNHAITPSPETWIDALPGR